eukprot:m.341236 g.341236  ORF g.341236 m.341236 type:complete len:414 (+) comp19942_c0_seq1:171-1412(+)
MAVSSFGCVVFLIASFVLRSDGASVVVSPIGAKADMDLKLVENTHCLDGTRAGYYHRPAELNTEGETVWVINLQGGGNCDTEEACKSRAETELGSSRDWKQTHSGSGVNSASKTANPDFFDAHQVYVPYCTGDLHAGNHNTNGEKTWGLWMTGHRNFVAIVTDLLIVYPQIRNAKRVLLSGCSAGGMGVYFNVDWLAETISWAKVKGAPIAGWYYPAETDDQPDYPFAPPSAYQAWLLGIPGSTIDKFEETFTLYDGYVDEECLLREQDKFHCGTISIYIKYIEADLFVMQNMYDNQQIESMLQMPPCSGSCGGFKLEFIKYNGRAVRKSVRVLKPGDAIFLSSCYDHCGGLGPGGSTTINGYTSTEVLGNWFFERAGNIPTRLIDDCGDVPCNPTCNSAATLSAWDNKTTIF